MRPEKLLDFALTYRDAATTLVAIAAGGAIGRGLFNRYTFHQSLISSAKGQLTATAPYYLRKAPTDLRSFKKAVILRGDHGSGKITFLCHIMLRDTYPWWHHVFCPPKGFYFVGNMRQKSAADWFKTQLNSGGKEDSLIEIRKLLTDRINEQPIRGFLHGCLPKSLTY